jgi:hypothetical protein
MMYILCGIGALLKPPISHLQGLFVIPSLWYDSHRPLTRGIEWPGQGCVTIAEIVCTTCLIP